MRDLFFNIDHQLIINIFKKYNVDSDTANKLKLILNFEWSQFDAVEGMHGRAFCQDNAKEFLLMRLAQYLAYTTEIIRLIYQDYEAMATEKINPIFDKYARMMEYTDPDDFMNIKNKLITISKVKENLLLEIKDELKKRINIKKSELPKTLKNSRPVENDGKKISSLDYYICEISLYSLKTLWQIRDFIKKSNVDFIGLIYQNTLFLAHKLNGEN